MYIVSEVNRIGNRTVAEMIGQHSVGMNEKAYFTRNFSAQIKKT